MRGTNLATENLLFSREHSEPQKMSGAEVLIRCLEEQGVDTIFGYPGGAVIDLYHHLARSNIRHILVRHEQGAVHAADGFARASGRVGVCLVTSGPGATNTVTGIASAYMDSVPVVVFTGQVPTALIGNDAFQEVDIVGITRPVTKHNYLVTSVNELTRVIREAFYLARSGRPGPVLVDLPKDIMAQSTIYDGPKEVKPRSYQPTYKPNMKQLRRAVELIKRSQRPMILAGGGVILSGASQELTEFALRISAPVTTTLMGLGAFPASHERLWLGMLGMHGTYRANMCTGACDLLIAIGARFGDRVTGRTDSFARQANIIHIDIDPTSIRKNVPVTVPVVGDCKISLKLLNEVMEEEGLSLGLSEREEWLTQIDEWKATKPLAYKQGESIKPQYVIETLHELTKGKAIITTEVGQNQMWAAQYYHFEEPNSFITSGGLGCMGFGLPAAIGAQLARPDKVVVDIAGDGSIQMNIQEFATAVQYNLNVKVVILNNGYLGMVRQWQELFFDRRYSHTRLADANPDFVKVAEGYGAVGVVVERPEEVRPALQRAMEVQDRPVLLDFRIAPEENVFPMVPAGQAIDRMLGGMA